VARLYIGTSRVLRVCVYLGGYASPNSPPDTFLQDGQTALHKAARNGHGKTIAILVALGATVESLDEVNPPHVAACLS